MRLFLAHRQLAIRPTLSLSLAPLSDFVRDSTDDEYDSSDEEQTRVPNSTKPSGSSDNLPRLGQNPRQTRGIKAMLMTISQGQILDATTRIMWLYVLEGIAPKSAKRFEWASVVIPPIVTLCSKAVGFPVQKTLPRPFPSIVGCLGRFSIPAAVLIGFGLVGRLVKARVAPRQRNMSRGSHSPNSNLIPPDSGTHLSPIEMVRLAHEQKPEFSRDYLNIFSPSIMKLKALVDWDLLDSVPDMAQRFQTSNCELMRFGAQGGLLGARSDAAVDDCLEVAVNNINRTAKWTQSFEFMNARELRSNWSHLVLWTMRLPDGYPVLLVRLGQAMSECSGKKAIEFTRALISQINRGVLKLLKDDGIDQLVVIVDCNDTRSIQITQYLRLLRRIPATLNQHYPGRLKAIHFANLPVVLRWVIQAIKPVVHPTTREKFIVHDSPEDMPPSLLEALNWGKVTADSSEPGHGTAASNDPQECSSPSGKEDFASEARQVAQKGVEASNEWNGSPAVISEDGHQARTSLFSRNLTERALATFLFLLASCILTMVILNELRHMDLKVGDTGEEPKHTAIN